MTWRSDFADLHFNQLSALFGVSASHRAAESGTTTAVTVVWGKLGQDAGRDGPQVSNRTDQVLIPKTVSGLPFTVERGDELTYNSVVYKLVGVRDRTSHWQCATLRPESVS